MTVKCVFCIFSGSAIFRQTIPREIFGTNQTLVSSRQPGNRYAQASHRPDMSEA